jgi:hypothetical protein
MQQPKTKADYNRISEKIRIQCGRGNLHTVHGDDVYGDRPLSDSEISVLQEWLCGVHL